MHTAETLNTVNAANTAETETGSTRSQRWHRVRPADEKGAVGTEMAIVVAIVVAISIALGAVMTSSAESHQACIPQSPGASIPADCND